MNKKNQPIPIKAASSMRRAIIYAILFLVVFLVGFVPMWVKVRSYSSSLSQAENLLSLTRLENTLASSAIDARRGDYETARQSASEFFTSLRAEIDKGNDSFLSGTQIAEFQPLLASRDGIITLISRADPASVDRLSELYVSYRRTTKR